MATTPDDDIDHGAALSRFLAAEWAALGTNRARWCRQHGLSDSTVLRWSQGSSNIDMAQMNAVARALGRPLVDILLAARYLTPEEVGGRHATPREPTAAVDAIRADPGLSDTMRAALLAVLRTGMSVESGEREAAGGVVGAPARRPARRSPRNSTHR
jgi:transcriptional regulator with XRE-family HTH domain